MEIYKYKDFTEEAFKTISKLQKGTKLLPKTGEDFIDSHLGCILPGDVILISALSGQGKTETLQRMKRKILSKEVNPNSDNYVFLDVSLEMKVFNIVLRGLSTTLNKKKSNILFETFSDTEKKLAQQYYEGLNDDRQYISQTPTTPEEFYQGASKFLDEHKDKEAVFIALDHVMLLSGNDKQSLLEKLCENINQLKLRYDNVYFILISQNNRSLLGRIAERNNNASPNAGDVFGSSFLDQLCSFNVILYNAFKMGIEEYMSISPERYDYLEKHFTEQNSKGKVSLNTENRIFVHMIKTRESDNPFKDIFVIEMDGGVPDKKENTLKVSDSLSTPTFTKVQPEPPAHHGIKPIFDATQAFDDIEPEGEDEGAPF